MKRLLRAMGKALVPMLILLAIIAGFMLIGYVLLLLSKTAAIVAILIAAFMVFTVIEYKYDRRK